MQRTQVKLRDLKPGDRFLKRSRWDSLETGSVQGAGPLEDNTGRWWLTYYTDSFGLNSCGGEDPDEEYTVLTGDDLEMIRARERAQQPESVRNKVWFGVYPYG